MNISGHYTLCEGRFLASLFPGDFYACQRGDDDGPGPAVADIQAATATDEGVYVVAFADNRRLAIAWLSQDFPKPGARVCPPGAFYFRRRRAGRELH